MLWPQRRKWLLGGAALIVVVLLGFNHLVLESLQYWGQESRQQHLVRLTVDGDQVHYSGTLHRLLLFDVYRSAMRQASLFGFGTDRTSTFPVRVPMGDVKAEAMRLFWTIDNHFILLQLRFGWLGAACFVALLLSSAIYSWQATASLGAEADVLFAAMAGLFAGLLVVLAVEWMSYDYGFAVLWSAGIANGWRAHIGARSPVHQGNRASGSGSIIALVSKKERPFVEAIGLLAC
jgi:hypothetical protein